MAQLKNGTSMGGYLAYHSGNFTTSTYVSTTYNSSLNTDSRNSRGVTRLYRMDDNSDYSVQTNWNGSRWVLYGYIGDSGHAACEVGYATTAGSSSACSGNAATVTHNASRTDSASYNVGWFSGTNSPAYSCDAVTIKSSTGFLYATNFQLSSDIILKDNIIPIPINPLNIDYKQFVMKSNPDQIRYGVIAQDLQVNYPELVSEGSQGLLSVSYTDLLVREVAYLKEKIKELERRIG